MYKIVLCILFSLPIRSQDPKEYKPSIPPSLQIPRDVEVPVIIIRDRDAAQPQAEPQRPDSPRPHGNIRRGCKLF